MIFHRGPYVQIDALHLVAPGALSAVRSGGSELRRALPPGSPLTPRGGAGEASAAPE
ncbi:MULTISPECIES: hypothetical protein [Sorangium]|uniref:hypothetical protein n=1 Tax=Sorangium TaxID=39643 RepID=UPI0002FA57C5|nr:hypothetical protein [Sorangium cellulosum]